MAYLQVLLGQDEQVRVAVPPTLAGGAEEGDIAADNDATHKDAEGEALAARTTSSAPREAREQ